MFDVNMLKQTEITKISSSAVKDNFPRCYRLQSIAQFQVLFKFLLHQLFRFNRKYFMHRIVANLFELSLKNDRNKNWNVNLKDFNLQVLLFSWMKQFLPSNHVQTLNLQRKRFLFTQIFLLTFWNTIGCMDVLCHVDNKALIKIWSIIIAHPGLMSKINFLV